MEYKSIFSYIQNSILILFLLILPFNLFLGKIFSFLVLLPFYCAEMVFIVLSFFIINKWKSYSWTTPQKYCLLFLGIFLVFGIISIVQNFDAIELFFSEHPWSVTQHSLFKKLISSDVTEAINKTLSIFFGIILFVGVTQYQIKKEKILKLMLVPLIIIILVNIFLVLFQIDVSLDGGKQGYVIHPYGLIATGRAYFPFVNATLLSMLMLLIYIHYYRYW